MLIVLMFVMVDLIILTIVTAVDDARYTARTVPDRENPDIMTVSQLSLWVVGTAQLSCLTGTQLHVLVVVLSTILYLQHSIYLEQPDQSLEPNIVQVYEVQIYMNKQLEPSLNAQNLIHNHAQIEALIDAQTLKKCCALVAYAEVQQTQELQDRWANV